MNEKNPGVQLEHEEALVKLYFPALQFVQFMARPWLKVPASQLVQVVAPVLIPVANPLGHFRHSFSRLTGAYRPASQMTHSLEL